MVPVTLSWVRGNRKWATPGTHIMIHQQTNKSTECEVIPMGRKNKVQMPQSTAGLVRYFDSTKESIKFKPEHVAIAGGVIATILIIARVML